MNKITIVKGNRRSSCKLETGLIHTIDFLRNELAEKDKEIVELRTQYDMYRSLVIQKNFADAEFVRSIRRQVCEEIRKKLAWDLEEEIRQDTKYDKVIKIFASVLDQIEKGE